MERGLKRNPAQSRLVFESITVNACFQMIRLTEGFFMKVSILIVEVFSTIETGLTIGNYAASVESSPFTMYNTGKCKLYYPVKSAIFAELAHLYKESGKYANVLTDYSGNLMLIKSIDSNIIPHLVISVDCGEYVPNWSAESEEGIIAEALRIYRRLI